MTTDKPTSIVAALDAVLKRLPRSSSCPLHSSSPSTGLGAHHDHNPKYPANKIIQIKYLQFD